MRRSILWAAIFLALAACAFGDDQEKAEKQIRMITAMSRDDIARSVISHTLADMFKVERPQLVAERKSLGLNYGGLFLAHELTQSGSTMEQITAQLRGRKNIVDIASTTHADWKRIASDAKKMNSRISDAIYKHFLHSKPDEERDRLEHYNSSTDLVRADADVTIDELLKARTEFMFRRNLAAPIASGQADRSSAVGRSYEQTREAIEDAHGSTPVPQ
jgi:hypothetical protein